MAFPKKTRTGGFPKKSANDKPAPIEVPKLVVDNETVSARLDRLQGMIEALGASVPEAVKEEIKQQIAKIDIKPPAPPKYKIIEADHDFIRRYEPDGPIVRVASKMKMILVN